jgi:predicted O-methyltransferase YrrM
MNRRLRQIVVTVDYLSKEAIDLFRGRPHHLTDLHTRAWYSSAEAWLPKCCIEALFPEIGKHPIELVWVPTPVDGCVWLNELVLLASICRHIRPRAIFEFGTFMGLTTANLAANVPPGSVVYTLDIPVDRPKLETAPLDQKFMLGHKAGEFYKASPHCSNVRQVWSDSADFDESPLAQQIDLVFIDGSHSYEYVRNDTEKALRMLRGGGTLLWHDYSHAWPGVVRFLHERADELHIKHIEGTMLAISRLAD